MTIRFGSEICSDRTQAEQREWLISNGLGSYGCGTVAGTRTRSYHGLLVAALSAPADPCTRTLLVAALEEHWGWAAGGGDGNSAEVLQGERELDGVQALDEAPALAGVHALEALTPIDHCAITAFRLEGTVPCWRFALGDALLEKRIWMQPGAHTTTVHYRLLQAGRALRLALRVLVNARSHHGGSERLPISVEVGMGGLEVHQDAHQLMRFVVRCDRGQVHPTDADAWCTGEPLTAERERGLPSEDLQLHAGWITAELSATQPTLTLVARTESDPPLDGERSLAIRRAHDDDLLADWRRAQPRLEAGAPDWVRQLVLAADAFVVRRATGHSLLAGYPWFGDWGRDTMMSLSGLTLATGRPAIGARILQTYAQHLSAGMLPNRFPEGGQPLGEQDFHTVDATLWFVEALRRQYEATGDVALIRELLPALREIRDAHCEGTRHGIRRDPADGLLRAGREGLQLTWMDAKVNGEVITPRIGKPVEVNALWCCALRTLADVEELCGDPTAARHCAELAAAARQGFERFWNEQAGCCFDVLDGPDGEPDATIRPNQLLALALSDQLLSPEQARRMLTVVGERLLTPMGLRSLDPRDRRYVGVYGGGPA